MKKKLLIAGGVVAALILLFVIVVAMQPSTFHVERSMAIDAPADRVFPNVNDLRAWDHWSPWAKLDPDAVNSYEGAEKGEGAIFKWAGNEEVGEGSMTIVESVPHERVRLRLAFIKPFEDVADVEFTFQPEGDATKVTWAMSGENNFVGKLFSMFMDLDTMIGEKYEQGLANMKKLAESQSSLATDVPAETTEPQ